jgi:site-specific DNA recombinase
MDASPKQSTEPQLRAALYARLSETYDAAESVPTQLANADRHAARRSWRVVARFKDDGYSAFKRIRRDDFVNLIQMIERDDDVDPADAQPAGLVRVREGGDPARVILSAYAVGDLALSTPEGAYYGGMETLRAKRESAVRSVRVREAHERIARKGKSSGGGRRWFGYTRVFADPDETVKRKRVILREEVNPLEADALRNAAERILRAETVGSIIHQWTQRGIKPSGGGNWEETSLVNTLKSPRLAGLREWQGQTYPAQWPAILDADTHERLVKLFSDPSHRAHVVGRKQHLLSGVARCGRCGRPLYNRSATGRAAAYACATGPGEKGCGGISVNAELLDEYVTGAVLDARESPPRAAGCARRAGHGRAAPRGTARGNPQGAGEAGRGAARLGRGHHRQRRLALHQAAHRGPHSQSAEGVRPADRGGHRVRRHPPSDMVRDAWQDWNTDRRRAAVKCVLNRVVVNPAASRAYGIRDRGLMLQAVRDVTEFDWRF